MNADNKRILELEAEVADLKDIVRSLLQEIERLKYPKNRRNIYVPPSKDDNRPLKKSLRTSEGKSPRGQTGHKGNTLKMPETPDFVIEHKPQYCNHCGKDINCNKAYLIA